MGADSQGRALATRVAWGALLVLLGLYLSIKYLGAAVSAPAIGTLIAPFCGIVLVVEGASVIARRYRKP